MPTDGTIDDVRVSLIHPQVGLGAGVEQRHDWHELVVVERGPYAATVAGGRVYIRTRIALFCFEQ